MALIQRKVFVTGGTGYLGRKLLPALRDRGHHVVALTRPGSESKVPGGIQAVSGNPLNPVSLRDALGDCDTWVQLVGTPRPAPWKAAQFRVVDLGAVAASLEALPGSAIRHYVYLSVAQPAPVMRAYVDIRAEAESRLRAALPPDPGSHAASPFAVTFLRPWYVLGPGHRWAYALLPLYALLESLPATRETALRMGMVTLEQMVRALVFAVENPPQGVRVVPVPDIRQP